MLPLPLMINGGRNYYIRCSQQMYEYTTSKKITRIANSINKKIGYWIVRLPK